jgi:hypothetical protein
MKPRDFIGGTNFRYAKFAPSFCSKDKWTNPIYKLVGSRRTRHGARENRRQSSRNGSVSIAEAIYRNSLERNLGIQINF